MEWSDNFSVGKQEIDDQHKELIRILNDIDSTIRKEEFSYLNLANIVSELEKYVKYHFDYEENLMYKRAYPGIAEHTSAHNAFRDKLQNTYVLDIQKPVQFYYNMSDYLVKWLTEHIMQIDKRLGEFLSIKNE